MTPTDLRQLLEQIRDAVRPPAEARYFGSSGRTPRQLRRELASIAAAGTPAEQIRPETIGGTSLAILYASHASARVEVCFDVPAGDDVSASSGEGVTAGWFLMRPGTRVRLPGGRPFRMFRMRLATGTPASSDPLVIGIDHEPDENYSEVAPVGNISAGGATDVLVKGVRASDDAEGYLEAADGSAAGRAVLAIAGHVGGTAYARLAASAGGRLAVAPIAGEEGVDGDAGAAGAATVRTVGATTPTAAVLRGTATGTSAQLAAAQARRKAIVIANLSDAESIYVAPDAGAATVAGGWPIGPGEVHTLTTTQAIQVIRGGAVNAAWAAWEELH